MLIQKILIYKGFSHNREESCGVIGSSIPDTHYKVGDLVYWETKSGDYGVNVVCYDENYQYKHPFIMGWACIDLRKTSDFIIKQVVVPAKLITKEIIEHHESTMTIIEKEIKQVTIDDIRRYVPFEFDLI